MAVRVGIIANLEFAAFASEPLPIRGKSLGSRKLVGNHRSIFIMMTDPIAAMLTIIRNANRIYRDKVMVRHSRMVEEIIKKIKQEGFIQDYARVEYKGHPQLQVTLKYGEDGEKVIRNITRISRPGRRVYQHSKDMKHKILGGLGIAIVSTSKGILTDRECREQNVGGEVLCTVW